MTTSSIQPPAPTPIGSTAVARVSEIDVSCRLPLLVLFISAAIWLVIGGIFELIASIKFHAPNFLADHAWLTYGRVHAADTNSVIYGFCVQAGLGAGIWLLAQLGAVRLAQPGLVAFGAGLWNLGVTAGVVGILRGGSTGFENLEMPAYAAVLLFLGYLLMSLWAMVTFHQRRRRPLFPSHWFLLTALLWFPWIYSTANLLLLKFPVRGVAQAVVAWWYSDNLLVVWLALAGLASVFYFVPTFTGRELRSRYLAGFAYWILVLCGAWGGIPHSAPLPVWMPVLSTIATVLGLLGFIAVGLEVCETAGCSWRVLSRGPLLGFMVFGTTALVLAAFLRAGMALLEVPQSLHLTWLGPAVSQLNSFGFFVMVMFGALYFIMPRLLGLEFHWPKLVRAHFWVSVAGVLLLVVPLALSGVVEAFKLQDANLPFVAVMQSTLPFLRVSTIGDLLLLIGRVFFLANLCALVPGFYRARAEATYAGLTADLFKPAGARS